MSPVPPSPPRPATAARKGIPPRPLSVPPAPITMPATPAPSFASPPTPSRAFTPPSASFEAARAPEPPPLPSPSYAPAPPSGYASGYVPVAANAAGAAHATIETPMHPPSVPPVFAPYATNAPLSRDWYVYQADGRHLGPLSTDFLARGWVARQVPHDIFVGTAGHAGWLHITQVPEIMEAVRALEAWNQVASAR